MTENEHQKKIENSVIDQTLFQKITAHNTHVNRHADVSDKDSLERTFDDVKANSTFDKNANPEELIADAILYKAGEIAKWESEADPYETKEFCVRLDPEDYGPIGTGFIYNHKTGLVKEYNTDTIRIVLQRRMNSPLGFSLLTAYPDMDAPDIQPTNRNLTPITETTRHFKEADPVGKAYLLYRTDPRNKTSVAYKRNFIPEDSAIYLHVSTENPDVKHIIKIKEQGVTLKTVKRTDAGDLEPIDTKYTQLRNDINPGKTFSNKNVKLTTKLIRDAFAKDYPNESKAIGAMIRTIRQNLPPERTYFIPQQSTDKTVAQKTVSRIQQAERLLPSGAEENTQYSFS